MPVRMDWDNPERTVIRVTFEGRWSTDDIHRMITKGISMVESVNHTVDSILDFTDSTSSPNNLLSTVGRMENTHTNKERLLIVVNGNGYIKALYSIARQLAPKALANLVFVDSIDEAHAHIAKQDTTIIA